MALVTRFGNRALFATQSLGKQARSRSLTGSPWAGKQIRVGNALRADAVLERAHHVILAYQVRECLAAIFAIERKECHRENSRISREGCVAQPIDLPLLPSGPGGIRRRSAAQFPADCLNF